MCPTWLIFGERLQDPFLSISNSVYASEMDSSVIFFCHPWLLMCKVTRCRLWRRNVDEADGSQCANASLLHHTFHAAQLGTVKPGHIAWVAVLFHRSALAFSFKVARNLVSESIGKVETRSAERWIPLGFQHHDSQQRAENMQGCKFIISKRRSGCDSDRVCVGAKRETRRGRCDDVTAKLQQPLVTNQGRHLRRSWNSNTSPPCHHLDGASTRHFIGLQLCLACRCEHDT